MLTIQKKKYQLSVVTAALLGLFNVLIAAHIETAIKSDPSGGIVLLLLAGALSIAGIFFVVKTSFEKEDRTTLLEDTMACVLLAPFVIMFILYVLMYIVYYVAS